MKPQQVNTPHPETPGRDADLLREEIARLQSELARFTDDRCYGRCDSPEGLKDWFVWETRGLLTPEEAHEVLDMLLNRLSSTPGTAWFSGEPA